MKILVTGANGQLGRELRNILDSDLFFSDISQEEYADTHVLDISDKRLVEAFIKEKQITHIINCAAYTQVDNAEKEVDKAFLINSASVKNLAELSNRYNIRLIHISTDFVFDGKKNTPYVEDDVPDPISVYGRSKLEGEIHIQNICTEYVIIRTSWLYSIYKNNFVKTIMKYAKEKGYIRVVYDQLGTPTHARDLAKIIVNVLSYDSIRGIYHFSNEGAVSWYDFAKAIIDISGLPCSIEPILTRDYPTLAKRPAYSVLDKSKIKAELGIQIPYWRESLSECLRLLA